MQDFTDKLVVITGAAGGVGRSLAIAMAEAGARVLAADIDEVGLEETKAALDATGATSYIRTCDVTSQESVDALAMGHCLQLPDSPPAAPIAATLDPACLDGAELIFVAVPVVANQASFMMIAERQKNHLPAVVSLCAKGIGKAGDGSAMLLTDLASQLLPDHPLAVFSGPSFADEVFAGLPAALVAASEDLATANRIQDAFEGSNFILLQKIFRVIFNSID